jgi:VWFA-related protein
MSPASAAKDQSQSGQAQKSLRYELSVTLKLTQVFVAGPDGTPAQDLERADFVLYDNGKLQKITDLEKHFIQTPESVASGPYVSGGAASPSPLLKRKYILLFDNESNDLIGVVKSRKAALEFLENDVQLGDEVAFFSCSPASGLRVHVYFTSNHQEISEAIRKIRAEPGAELGGLAVESFSEHELANPEHPTLDGLFSLFKDFDSGANRRPYSRRDLLVRLTELAKALRRVDGQKNIIFFSRAFRHIMDSPSSPDAVRFRKMAGELASANCPVFVVNTAGGIESASSPNAGLSYLSDVTGGRYYDAVDHYAENAQNIRNVTSNYYVLGYPVDSSWDGKFHEIKVEVRRKGYRAFGQKGYFNPLPFNKLSAMEKSLHLIDVALGEDPYFEQPICFPLTVLPYSDGPGNNTLLLSLMPVRMMLENLGKRTEIISLVLAEDKSIVTGRRAEVDWTTLAAETLCQYSAAALVPGHYEARVVVRNLETGRAAVGAGSFELPGASDAPVKLFPPLFIGSFRSMQYVNFSGDANDKNDHDFSLTQAFLFPTRKYSPLPAELEEGSEVFRVVLRCEQKGPEAQDFQVRAGLEIPGIGGSIPLEVVLLDRFEQEHLLFLVLEFWSPAPIATGSYTLRVVAENPQTSLRTETTCNLTVKQ